MEEDREEWMNQPNWHQIVSDSLLLFISLNPPLKTLGQSQEDLGWGQSPVGLSQRPWARNQGSEPGGLSLGA